MKTWDEKTFAKFTYLNDIQISSDDNKIAFTATKANIKDDKYEPTVIVKFLSENIEKYIENTSRPKISPDGRKIAVVVNDEKEKNQFIKVCSLFDTSCKKVGKFDAVVDYEWNADGRRILVTTYKRRADEHFFFEDRVPIWFDSKGFLDGEKTVIQIIDAENAEAIDETVMDHFTIPYFKSAIWHGNEILITVPNPVNPYKKFDIYIYNEGGKPEILMKDVSFLPYHSNGTEVLLIGKPKKKKLSEHDKLYIWKEGTLNPLAEDLKYDVKTGKLDSKGNVYFTIFKEGRVPLYMSTHEGELKPISEGDFWITDFDVGDKSIAVLKETSNEPAEIYLIKNGEEIKITSYNTPLINKIGAKAPNHFKYESGGLELDGWYIKPDMPSKNSQKAPVIVFVHGGPKGMYGYYFKYEFQLLASRGYYILYVNPRGSDGYDEEFALKVLGRTGLEDFQDILNGVKKFLELEPQADGERIGITGISYGGYMTNWALTQSDIFKAGVSENGISLWLTSYAYSDIGLWFDKEVIGGDPLEDKRYLELSPLFHAKNVKAPILLIHSLEDYRCPLDQSVMFYHVLKDLGKEAYIAIFKKGPHGHSIKGSPKHRMKRYKLLIEFFERKLKSNQEFNIDDILKK